MRKKKFHKSRDVVKALLGNLGINKENFALFDIWEKESGKLGEFARIIRIKNGVLTVQTDSPLCYQEIVLNKSLLLNKINGHYGKKILDDIRVINSNERTRQ